jgi:uncharacterized protein YeaO (DUF488 family)
VTVHTTYFGGLGHLAHPDDGDRVIGVVRYPRPFVHRTVDRNVPGVAPPAPLLDAFKSVEEAAETDDAVANPARVAWESMEFGRQYESFLRTDPAAEECVAGLREEYHDVDDLWLVCWEKDVRYCHRRLLAGMIVEGIDVYGRTPDVEHHPTIATVAAEERDDADASEDGDARLTDFADGGEL